VSITTIIIIIIIIIIKIMGYERHVNA